MTDDHVARIYAESSVEQVVELIALVALENDRSRTNMAMGLFAALLDHGSTIDGDLLVIALATPEIRHYATVETTSRKQTGTSEPPLSVVNHRYRQR